MGGVALDAAGQRPLAEAAVQARDHSGMPAPRIPARGLTTPTALAAVQAGQADGISYVLTEADPFAAIDLDHCRHPDTGSIDVWAQNFLDVARHTYSEVTPSGEGCRIWGLTGDDTAPVNRKFTLEIDGKQIAAELFRRTPKALTITGYRLDSIRELTNSIRLFDWAIVWGERRKAAAAETAAAHRSTATASTVAGPATTSTTSSGSCAKARAAPTAVTSSTWSSAITSAAAGASSRSTNTCSNSRTALPAATSARAGFPVRSPGAPASTTIVCCRCSTAGRRRIIEARETPSQGTDHPEPSPAP